MAFIVCVVIAFSAPTMLGVTSAIVLFFVLRYFLREMASEDPILIRVHHASQQHNQGLWTSKPKRTHRWLSR
jgi:type IV secretory pathway TrbD component